MRRPKRKHTVGNDHCRYLITAHGDASDIEISATEKEDSNQLIIEVERHEGDVVLIVPKGLRIEYKG